MKKQEKLKDLLESVISKIAINELSPETRAAAYKKAQSKRDKGRDDTLKAIGADQMKKFLEDLKSEAVPTDINKESKQIKTKKQKLEVTLNEIKRMQELAGIQPLNEGDKLEINKIARELYSFLKSKPNMKVKLVHFQRDKYEGGRYKSIGVETPKGYDTYLHNQPDNTYCQINVYTNYDRKSWKKDSRKSMSVRDRAIDVRIFGREDNVDKTVDLINKKYGNLIVDKKPWRYALPNNIIRKILVLK
jgi:hypothetical protein